MATVEFVLFGRMVRNFKQVTTEAVSHAVPKWDDIDCPVESHDSGKEQAMTTGPWYKDGLRFTCTQCGNCCSGAPGFVWVTPEEIQQIADFKGLSLGEMQIHHLRYVAGRTSLREFPNGNCTFLDGATRRCTVYPVRPAQCRTWPFWNSNLESEETWKHAQVSCPGIGCGELYTLEQVVSKSEVVDI